MAEERIFIITRHKDEKSNMTFTDMCKEYTRTEAIERMAKGIVNILAVQPGTQPDPWEIWKDYAQSALDALLKE